MVGLALPESELPVATADRHGLAERLHRRGGEPEFRFLWRAAPPLLPVWWDGRLHVARWGSMDRRARLPVGGWTWEETVRGGGWAGRAAEPVDVPGNYVWAGGVWTRVRHGVRALLVRDAAGEPAVYVICRPSTRYYRIMTGVDFQPVLIGEVI